MTITTDHVGVDVPRLAAAVGLMVAGSVLAVGSIVIIVIERMRERPHPMPDFDWENF